MKTSVSILKIPSGLFLKLAGWRHWQYSQQSSPGPRSSAPGTARSSLLPITSLGLIHIHENKILFCLSWLKAQFAKVFSEHPHRTYSRIYVQSPYVMSYPFAYMCMFATSFLPSGPCYSVQSGTALTEHSRQVTVPGTSGNTCSHLWVQRQTQPPSLAP